MKLWTMWYQGRDQAPEFCQRILRLWEVLNPDMELHVAERDEVHDRLSGRGLVLDGLGLEKVANLYRTDVLATEGGIWVDATVLPMRPLADWFIGTCDTAGFFVRRDPRADCHVSNWMIYSEPGHPLCRAWRDRLFEYYALPRNHTQWTRMRDCRSLREIRDLRESRRAPDHLWFVDRARGFTNPFAPYFVMHYMFAEMIRTDPALAAEWARVPAVPTGNTMLIGTAMRDIGWDRARLWIEDYLDLAPVHKLAHKHSDFRPILDMAERRIAGRVGHAARA